MSLSVYMIFIKNFGYQDVLDVLIGDANTKEDDIILHTILNGNLKAADSLNPGERGIFKPEQTGSDYVTVAGYYRYYHLEDSKGDWNVAPLAYTGVPAADSDVALSILNRKHSGSKSHAIETSVIFNEESEAEGGGFIIFDYSDDSNYKYAGLDQQLGKWVIGEYVGGNSTILAEPPIGTTYDIKTGVPYYLKIDILHSESGEMDSSSFAVGPARNLVKLYINQECKGGYFADDELVVSGDNNFGVGTNGSGATFNFFRVAATETQGVNSYWITEDFGGTQALGITSDRQAFIPDGSGGYYVASYGENEGDFTRSSEEKDLNHCAARFAADTWNDYCTLTWKAGGTVWDLNELAIASGLEINGEDWDEGRSNILTGNIKQDLYASFSKAFTNVLALQLSEANIELVPSDTSVVTDVQMGIPGIDWTTNTISYPFHLTFTGDGAPHELDLDIISYTQAVDDAGNVVTLDEEIVGCIPVTIYAGVGEEYVYTIEAIDPDGDTPLSYAWTVGSENYGAVLSNDGVVIWNPTEAGSYDFSITVSDGRGGVAIQSWTVDVVPAEYFREFGSPVYRSCFSSRSTDSPDVGVYAPGRGRRWGRFILLSDLRSQFRIGRGSH